MYYLQLSIISYGQSHIVAVGTFIAVNVLDLIVGMIAGIIKHIHRRIKDKRLLKSFCQLNSIDDNANAVK